MRLTFHLGRAAKTCSAVCVLIAAIIRPASGATLVVTNTADSGTGSLREAIALANATTATPDTISFNIAGAGPHTISPVTPLPALTAPVVIDGYTQPGASMNTLTNGDDAVLQIVVLESVVIDTTNSVVRGLVTKQIQIGVAPGPKGSNIVEGCFVGLSATGTNSLGSPGSGVFVQTPNNRIGGTTAAARNIISGKGGVGLELFEAFATNNQVQGNFIGTDRTGTKAIGNGERAVAINMAAFANYIGGPGAGNLISGNLERGITMDGSSNKVYGNFIGTDVTGTKPLGNARSGIEIGGVNNFVGSANAGYGNIIAFNGVNGNGFTTNGIDIKAGTTDYFILGNSIFENMGLGIDVNANGQVTPGFPIINLVSNTTAGTIIKGWSTPNASVFLQLFTSPSVDPSGYGEGKTFVFSGGVPTDAGSNFTINLPSAIAPGLFLTATLNGLTEFSQARMVIAAGTTNSWTNNVGGKWETGAKWSLNVPPYGLLSQVLITNAGTKTVSNDITTASQFPSTMTISNLTIGAPSGATNTLLLSHGGTSTPLRLFNALNVNSGGALVISNGALSLEGGFNGASRIDGAVTLLDGALVSTNNNNRTYIGHSGRGTFTISNGTFESYYPIVGLSANSVGTWNIAGGTNRVATTFDIADSLTATGRVVMTGGELYTPSCYVGLFGNGSMTVSNGFVSCDGQILLGSQSGSVGNFTTAGGYISAGSMVVSEGFQSTGNLLVTDTAELFLYLLEARTGGTIWMDGGTIGAERILMTDASQFIFNQGELLVRSLAMSNNAPFVVGDGTNTAAFDVYPDGTNIFPKGLRISPNGKLGGNSFISGMVTNSGVIDPGFNFPYFTTLEINGGLVLSNNSDLHFDISGDTNYYAPCDFIAASGNVVLAGKLSLKFAAETYDDEVVSLQPLAKSKRRTANKLVSRLYSETRQFLSTVTNGAGFVLLTNNNTLTGAFTNVASGGLLTTADGYARFTVLYAGSKMLRVTNMVILDTDGDGMPNWWEDEYGTDKNVTDGELDTDGDGASNFAEYRAGTDPKNSGSVFSITSLLRETNNVRVTWKTVGGRNYWLQTNAVVDGGLSTNYADLSPMISTLAGDSESTTNFVHTNGFNVNFPARFYRIRLAP